MKQETKARTKEKTPAKGWSASGGKAKMRKKKTGLEIPWGKIRLLVLLIWLLGVQAIGLFSAKSAFEKVKERVIRNPNDFEARLILAEELIKNNRLEEAEHELFLAPHQRDSLSARQIDNNELQNVLGLETSKLDALILQKQENDPEDLEILISKWQKVLAEKHDYRDGWLKLALYLIKVGKISEAREALEKAREIDPNYELVGKLENLLP